jgi:hypothetical protein
MGVALCISMRYILDFHEKLIMYFIITTVYIYINKNIIRLIT